MPPADPTGPAPALVRPTTAVRESFLAAMAEYAATGERPWYADPESRLPGIREHRRTWHTPAGFAAFVDWALAIAAPGGPLPPGLVPSLDLWWVAGGEYLGRVSLRTPLTDALRREGGNLGYDVRPSARGRGHASAMVAAALPYAAALGIGPALVTIQAGNAASLAVARRNGAREFARDGTTVKLWLPTTAGLSS